MLFAPTAAKHDLVTSNAVGGLKSKSNCGDAAVALTNGLLGRFNHSQTQQQHRQHHNRQEQQRDQKQQQQPCQNDLKVKFTQPHHQQRQEYDLRDHHNLHQSQSHVHVHVRNSVKSEDQQQENLQKQLKQQQQNQQNQQQQQQEHLQQTNHQQQLTMEAISKLDVTLAACLANEMKEQKIEKQQETSTDLELCSMDKDLNGTMFEQLEIFKRISSIKLHMEAMTLQPEGTKRMELLQNDIRPIFTVECQLSCELIKSVPRYDMFHVMQFESEKFHSLTQCTRFGQEAERAINMNLTDDTETETDTNADANTNANSDIKNNNNNININNNGNKLNFGKIHFTVWWREPGTCLNEMLGVGVLALDELYAASVLEQCKNIVIQRRNMHLANLYCKISLQTGSAAIEANMISASIETEITTTSDNTIDKIDRIAKEINGTDATQNNEKSGNTGNRNTNSNDNDNNVQIETTHFIAETSRVRLLRGFICASDVRQLNLNEDRDYLVCRRFWENELAVATAGVDNKFNYQEQFAVLNDDAFLQRVERQYLQLELWRRQSAADSTNGNENIDDIRPLGIARLPLHQFFIAYRDMTITNHLCKGKLPVVSFDAWAPIISYTGMGKPIGELRCVLAIGSDEQIAKLKETHGYTDELTIAREVDVDKKLFLQRPLTSLASVTTSLDNGIGPQQAQTRSTANLLEFLQRSLTAQPPSAAPPPPRMPPEAAGTLATMPNVPTSLMKPLQMPNVKSFRFLLEIQRASGLPRNPGVRGKKSSKRNNANKQQRFPPNEAPSTYVTFQADEGFGPVYKSHEGAVYATNIVEKSIQPQWQQRFHISASVEYLLNPQKRFILKVWKKAATDSPQKRQQPTPLEDAIVGFAALDLNVFMRGLYLAGCFNIVDFNGRINGQLEVRSQPIEDLQQLLNIKDASVTLPQHQQPVMVASAAIGHENLDSFIDEFDNALGLAHINLGQAIKRKFNELEGISQRLRTRLVDVTGEQLAPEFNISLLDDWQAEKDKDNNLTPNDGEFDEFDQFEHDINTSPVTSPSTQFRLSPSLLLTDGNNDNDNEAAQIDKTQFNIASIASASLKIERKDASKKMTRKE